MKCVSESLLNHPHHVNVKCKLPCVSMCVCVRSPSGLCDEIVTAQSVAAITVKGARLHGDTVHTAVHVIYQTKHLHHPEACVRERDQCM